MIKEEDIEEMFQRHFKTMLGPQEDSEEPSIHPTIAHMDAVRIIETIDLLQALTHQSPDRLNIQSTNLKENKSVSRL